MTPDPQVIRAIRERLVRLVQARLAPLVRRVAPQVVPVRQAQLVKKVLRVTREILDKPVRLV